MVAADQLEPLRIFGRSGKGCRQLQRVRPPQRVKPKQSDRTVANLFERLDLYPTGRQPPKPLQGPVEPAGFEMLLPVETVQGRRAFDAAPPPRNDRRIVPDRGTALGAARLVHEKCHES